MHCCIRHSTEMSSLNLQLKPINLQQHAALCLKFMEDTHLCSFGSMDGFDEDGQGLECLTERISAKAQDPESCLHVWQDNIIVGQLNFGTFVGPAIGYISHFYITPEWRGRGVAEEMDAYAGRHFRLRGFRAARLSVIAANARAMRFYQHHGWRGLGPREDCRAARSMEKAYE